MSRIGSYGTLRRSAGTTATASPLNRIVWPSGVDLAIASIPMRPSAPGRFSTMTFSPSALASSGEIARARMSFGPPAVNGTIARTARSGYSARTLHHGMSSDRASTIEAGLHILRHSNRSSTVMNNSPDASFECRLRPQFYLNTTMANSSICSRRSAMTNGCERRSSSTTPPACTGSPLLDARFADHLVHSGHFLVDRGIQLRRCAAGRLHARRGQTLLRVGPLQYPHDLLVESRDDRLRRLCRNENAVDRNGLEPGHAGFCDRRQIGIRRGPRCSRDRKRSHPPGLYMRAYGRRCSERQLHFPRHDSREG